VQVFDQLQVVKEFFGCVELEVAYLVVFGIYDLE